MSKGYNGWKNYETWAVNLWLSNEEPTWDYWLEEAVECRSQAAICPQVAGGVWQADRAAVYLLADRLKEEIRDDAPEVVGMYADLLGAALDEVDWLEIAEALLESAQ